MTSPSWRRTVAGGLRQLAADVLSPWGGLPEVSETIDAAGASRKMSYRQFRTLIEGKPSNVLEAVAGTTIWVVALWLVAPGLKVLAWGACMYALVALSLTQTRRYVREKPSDDALRLWEVRLGRLATLQGALWGSLWFVFPDEAGRHAPYVAVGLLLVIAGSMSMLVSYRPAVSWISVPCTVLTCIGLIARANLYDVAIGLGFGVAVGLMIRLAQVHNSLITQSMLVAQERVLLLEELEGQRAAAQQANEAKTRFLAAVSHDLRQPMHSIALLTDALRLHSDGDADVLRQMGASVQAMDDMLAALLEVSKLDDGALPLQLASLPVASLFERIELQFAAQALDNGLVLRVMPCNVRAVSDSYQLQRVLANLVANALRYTLQGHVIVRCRLRGATAWLQVWDTGPGIARRDRQRIFEEFVQVTRAQHTGAEGLGLGLSIVRKVAQRLSHPVVLRSRLQRGSMFAIGVPLEKTSGLSASTASDEARLADLLVGQLILLIDDDAVVLKSMKLLLEAFQCHVLIAHSTASALEAVQGSLRTPDLIISDFRLSDGDTGVDAIAQVRTLVGEALPAVLVTAETTPARAAAHPLGLAVLAKPLQTHVLAPALSRVLGAAT